MLAADYPAARLSCYISDNGDVGDKTLAFEALFEAAGFTQRWVPFCWRHAVESGLAATKSTPPRSD